MKERGVLFSAPMVRAILAGQKTVTRRICKLPELQPSHTLDGFMWRHRDGHAFNHIGTNGIAAWCPYGTPGDRLWVRETWRTEELPGGQDGIRFRADDAFVGIPDTAEAAEQWGVANGNRCAVADNLEGGGLTWRPGIHLRRVHARLVLDVVSVRVERLHEIDEADARREGVAEVMHFADSRSYRDAYRTLWNDINGAGAWDLNPFVWRVEFARAA